MDILDYNTNAHKIKGWQRQKKNNEVQLARKLLEIFEEYPLKNIVQAIAKAAVIDLIDYGDLAELSNYLDGDRCRFWNNKRQRARDMQGTPRLDQFQQIYATSIPTKSESDINLDASDCADILHIYSEFIEKAGEGKAKFTKSRAAFAQQFGMHGRKWSHYEWLQARRKIRGEEKILKGKKWGWVPFTKKDRMKKGLKIPGWARPEFMASDFFEGIKFFPDRKDPTRHVPQPGKPAKPKGHHVRLRLQHPDNVKDTLLRLIEDVWLYNPEVDPEPGIVKWKLHPMSAVYQLDRMFGLPEGADISGTTADTIFGIEVLYGNIIENMKDAKLIEDLLEIRPLISLLPIASMVSRGHHTTLECALTLTLNDYISYGAGYYKTLYPEAYNQEIPNFNGKGFRQTTNKIWKALDKHTNTQQNRVMILYFEAQEGGAKGVIDATMHREVFEQLFTLKQNLLTYMPIVYDKYIELRFPSVYVVAHTLLTHGLAKHIDPKFSKVEYIAMTQQDATKALHAVVQSLEQRREKNAAERRPELAKQAAQKWKKFKKPKDQEFEKELAKKKGEDW